MDTLSLLVDPAPLAADPRHAPVTILVNGRDLIDLVREIERPFAIAEGCPDIAGGYAGLPAAVALAPSRHLLGEPAPGYDYTHEVTLLQCECGEPGCWPLLARVRVSADAVTWSHFRQPHRDGRNWRSGHRARDSLTPRWRHEGLGPFRFDRAQYEAELARWPAAGQ